MSQNFYRACDAMDQEQLRAAIAECEKALDHYRDLGIEPPADPDSVQSMHGAYQARLYRLHSICN